MVDAIPKAPPAAIAAEYAQRRAEADLVLERFIGERFELPEQVASSCRTGAGIDVVEHIDRLWGVLRREPQSGDARGSLLPLPRPVPGGRYR